MPGTKIGGRKVAATNKMKYGTDYYANIGRLGGSAKTSKPKGFAAMPHNLVSKYGRIGGKMRRERYLERKKAEL